MNPEPSPRTDLERALYVALDRLLRRQRTGRVRSRDLVTLVPTEVWIELERRGYLVTGDPSSDARITPQARRWMRERLIADPGVIELLED